MEELRAKNRKKIKETKENWLEESCKEVEELIRNHDYFNLHKKLKSDT